MHQLRSIEAIKAMSKGSTGPLATVTREKRMSDNEQDITEDQWRQAKLIWDYHQMHHELRPVDVAIGLGSHDLSVAAHSAELHRAGLFPVLVFTGGNSPTTAKVFPRGEAVHFREHAIDLGVPAEAILLEHQPPHQPLTCPSQMDCARSTSRTSCPG